MRVGGMPVALLLLLLWLCAARGSAGAGGGKAIKRRINTSGTSPEDCDGKDEEAKLSNITQVEPTSVILGPNVLMASCKWGRDLVEEVVLGRRPPIDFGSILQHGDAIEILAAFCLPSRLVRSILLSWVATEAWRKCGLFQRRRRPKKQRPKRKVYRRFTSTRKTYKQEVKGVIEEPLDEELFQQQYASNFRQRTQASSKPGDAFTNIVPESQEKENFLTKTQKESVLKEYEVRKPASRYKKSSKKRLFRLKSFRLTRKKKFRVAWTLGHIVSPFLLTPVGSALAGWMVVLCATSELIPCVDKKFKLDVLEDNGFAEWLLEPFRDNEVLKAILFGSLVGACHSNNIPAKLEPCLDDDEYVENVYDHWQQ